MRLPKVDRLVNLCLLVAAVVVLTSQLNRACGPRSTARTPAPYVGAQLPAIAAMAQTPLPRSLILYVDSRCALCTGSMPFYRTLIKVRDDTGTRLEIVAFAREDDAAFREYLEGHGLAVDRRVAVSPTEFPELNTPPTILLIDDQKNIEMAWVGRLDTDDEAAMLSLVSGGTARVRRRAP